MHVVMYVVSAFRRTVTAGAASLNGVHGPAKAGHYVDGSSRSQDRGPNAAAALGWMLDAAPPNAAGVDRASAGRLRSTVLAITVPGRNIPISAVRDAATAVYGAAVRTPLIRVDLPDGSAESFALNGAELYLKLEVLQPIGSFKLRGAYNVVRQLSPAQLEHGVWTVSAGNAAQGVAFAARKVGARCSVMVMDTAPDTKIRAIERLGASIVRATYDECWQTVESHGSDRMTGHFVHPFDDDRFIAGNAHRWPRDSRRPS